MKTLGEYALEGLVGYLTGFSNEGPKNILYGATALTGAFFLEKYGGSFGPGFFSDAVEPAMRYILLVQGVGHTSRGIMNLAFPDMFSDR